MIKTLTRVTAHLWNVAVKPYPALLPVKIPRATQHTREVLIILLAIESMFDFQINLQNYSKINKNMTRKIVPKIYPNFFAKITLKIIIKISLNVSSKLLIK